ncbi:MULTISPECIES: PLP-dependent aminotransferase family protein [Mesorhizobium]|uniref:PLP-dependent aminotransferase family protein n=1 Tax=Mesorhizobium denitrificans TaxID=2294114 RepID=A0A371XJL2_9HYPH|nr:MULTISPECIES: PLP-dependent aminotransferase family protein [Mesorhizobium]RFC69416.1 PLP-dependent aminotransferase family protein [Mesorhizobium denitrificans]
MLNNERGAAVRPSFSRWLSQTNDITQQFMAMGVDPSFISMAGGLPAAEFYPVAAAAEAADRALSRWGAAALEYGPVDGFMPLRAHIADRMSRMAGRHFDTSNVLLTVGAMQGLDLIGKVLIDEGDRIVTQYPTYVGALDAWRPRQPVYTPLDWGKPGTSVETLRSAKFVYGVPNYSNPTGALVPTPARAALLEKALEADTWLVEDDPYLPLQYDGDAGPSMLALDGAMMPGGPYNGPVIYLGTLSKSIVPGLRVGWVIASPDMIAALTLAKQSTDISSSMLTHAVALELLEADIEKVHVPGMVGHYRERRDALCAAALETLAPWFEWQVPSGGMFVWMKARNSTIDTGVLYARALREKVAYVPGSVFDPAGVDTSSMRINFTRNAPDVLREGARRLAVAAKDAFG